VPFTPRFNVASDRVDAAAVADAGGVPTTTTFKSPPLTNTIPPKPSASKSTPPVSVMKRHSSFQSNPNTPNVAKPTPKTRRVLFSESEHGQVDTEQFFYDKTMPSARKLPRPNENRQQMIVEADATQTIDTPNRTSPTNSASKVLRPSKFGASNTTENKIQQQQQSVQSQVATVNQPSTAEKKQQAQQDEQSKQQYIEKYGLLPSITPLSKRYGRMKRQQGQSFAIAKIPSKNVTASTSTNGTNNVKRKRRDIMSAASRMGRRRLNNHRTGGSSLPVVLLGKNRTPMKRRREDEMNRADEWVWRAMNSNGEKENLDSQGGGATKRTKFGNDVPAPALPPGLSTPPKSAKKASPSVTTPPKTPGPSTFSFGSSTPAPKSNKNSDIGATPAKTPLPSFAFNDASSSSSVGFSFGTNASSSGGNAVDTPSVAAAATKPDEKEVSGPSFSFGSTPAKTGTAAPSFSLGDTASKSNDATTAASFTFGATSAVKPEEKKDSTSGTASVTACSENKGSDKSQAFSFGATSTPVPNGAQDTTAKASFSFGSVGQPNTPATSASTSNETKQTPSFSFGGASAATPSSTFAFGATNQTPSEAPAPSTVAAPSDAKQAPSFSFGGAPSATQSGFATPAAAAPTETKQTPSFSFGGATAATPSAGFATPAAAAPTEAKQTPSFAFGNPADVSTPASTFSFGSSNQPPAAAPVLGGTPAPPTSNPAPPTFAFGGQAPGAGGLSSNPSSFSLGGSASGASARRRARSGRRK